MNSKIEKTTKKSFNLPMAIRRKHSKMPIAIFKKDHHAAFFAEIKLSQVQV